MGSLGKATSIHWKLPSMCKMVRVLKAVAFAICLVGASTVGEDAKTIKLVQASSSVATGENLRDDGDGARTDADGESAQAVDEIADADTNADIDQEANELKEDRNKDLEEEGQEEDV